MPFFTMFLRIFLAAVMGGLVGFEREMRGRSAGLRTHMLVCVGSALFMAISILVSLEYSYLGNVDPSRIAAGVVTGIGFLGAGAVIRFGSSAYIQGLTTAASIWAVSAIGLAFGAGFYSAGIITTFVVLGILFLSRIERRLDLKDDEGHSKKEEKV